MKRERPKALSMLEYAGSWAGAYLLRRGLYMPHELSSWIDEELVHSERNRMRVQ